MGGGEKCSNNRNDWDEVLDTNLLFEEYVRILRPKGRVILFSQEPYTKEIRNQKVTGITFSYPLIWYKNTFGSPLSANKKPLNIHEDLSVFLKVHDTNFNHPLRTYAKKCVDYIGLERQEFLKKIGWKMETFFYYWDCLTFKRPSQKLYDDVVETFKLDRMDGFLTYKEILEIDKKQSNFVFNRLTDKAETSVLEYAKDTPSCHPTQKPVKLLEHLIKMYTNEGDTVLDNCMGSGSTGVACVNTKRHFIGIEKDDEYFDIAIKRINEAGSKD